MWEKKWLTKSNSNNWVRTKEIILTEGEKALYPHGKESEAIYAKKKKIQSIVIIL